MAAASRAATAAIATTAAPNPGRVADTSSRPTASRKPISDEAVTSQRQRRRA